MILWDGVQSIHSSINHGNYSWINIYHQEIMLLDQIVLIYFVCYTVGFYCLNILLRDITKNNLIKKVSVFALRNFTESLVMASINFLYRTPHKLIWGKICCFLRWVKVSFIHKIRESLLLLWLPENSKPSSWLNRIFHMGTSGLSNCALFLPALALSCFLHLDFYIELFFKK